MQSYIIKCQSSPVDILNINKKLFPKFLKLTVSASKAYPLCTFLNKKVPKIAKMKKVKNIRPKTLIIAGAIFTIMLTSLFRFLKWLKIRTTLKTKNIETSLQKALSS
jgi:hypothetical protein